MISFNEIWEEYQYSWSEIITSSISNDVNFLINAKTGESEISANMGAYEMNFQDNTKFWFNLETAYQLDFDDYVLEDFENKEDYVEYLQDNFNELNNEIYDNLKKRYDNFLKSFKED